MKDAKPGEFLRAGRTKVTLRQRVYQNHLMGDQKGNLRSQLVQVEEMAEDGLDLNDVEAAVLNGITPVGTVGRFTGPGRYLIITIYKVTERES